MNVGEVIAEILKREGIGPLIAYPLNPLTETATAVGLCPIIVRQERVGIHMADAISRQTSGDRVGVFCMQAGPGVENSFGAVAQAYSEAVPLVVIPGGASRSQSWVMPNFHAAVNFQHVTKWQEQITTPEQIAPAMRRAFTQARNGRPGPVLVEIPGDMWGMEVEGEIDYIPSKRALNGADTRAVDEAAATLINAKTPLLYAGQGVHYAKAWDELRELAELLEVPVCTSLEGKSAFPENHALALGSGGVSMSLPVFEHVRNADVVFGTGASFTRTGFGIRWQSFSAGKTFIHNTVDPVDINKDIVSHQPLVGDAKLTLASMVEAVRDRLGGRPRGRLKQVSARIEQQREKWMAEWRPLLRSEDAPISPYRVIWDLLNVADVPNTIITHDAGSPRDELSPFWQSITPLSYIGWGKSTQLGYGLGLAIGAKIAKPDKLCINVWGDAAIGMTGMDFETAVRNNIPILSILFNNFSMAMEIPYMQASTRECDSTDISGNYAEFAKALGGYGERVTDPSEITHALVRGIRHTQEGRPALLEFITTKDKVYSTFNSGYGEG